MSSSGSCEGTVSNEPLHVILVYGLGGKTSLFLKEWELAMVALTRSHGPGHVVPGNA